MPYLRIYKEPYSTNWKGYPGCIDGVQNSAPTKTETGKDFPLLYVSKILSVTELDQIKYQEVKWDYALAKLVENEVQFFIKRENAEVNDAKTGAENLDVAIKQLDLSMEYMKKFVDPKQLPDWEAMKTKVLDAANQIAIFKDKVQLAAVENIAEK